MKYSMRFLIMACLIHVGFYSLLQAQPNCPICPVKQWDLPYSGSSNDYLTSMLSLPDGNILLGGYSNSNPAFEKSDSSRGGNDFWIIKTDAQGNKIWDKTFGSTGDDRLADMLLLPDGGFLLGGYSNSPAAFEKSDSSRGANDYWIVRTDAQGNKIWDKTFGGSGADVLTKMLMLPGGGYLLGGYSNSNASSEKSENSLGSNDYWVVRIDTQGNTLWDKTLGGSNSDVLRSMLLLSDGILLGGSSFFDFRVIKINLQGDKIWDKTFGYRHYDTFSDMLLLPDGNILLGGHTQGNALFNSDPYLPMLIKVDPQGSLIWQKVIEYYPGYGTELYDLDLLPDGSFLLNGEIRSSDKSWAIRTDANANVIWDQTLISADNSYGDAILVPGGFLMGRYFVHSKQKKAGIDFWVARFDFVEDFQNQALEAFLVNANTDQIIREIQTGAVIDVEELGTDFLSFVVEDKDGQFKSVDFKLEGPISFQKTENLPPYALFGDNPGNDFIGQNFPEGAYTLTITPYAQSNLQGTSGTPLQISFQVEGELFTLLDKIVLINADTDKDIRTVKRGDIIDMDMLGTNHLSFRVDPLDNRTKSVKMELSGALTHTQVENIKPFALFGDEAGSLYNGKYFVAGDYVLKVTPYTGANLSGQAGVPLEVNFKLTGIGLNIPTLILVNADTDTDIGPLMFNGSYNLDQIGTRNLTIRTEGTNNRVKSVVFQLTSSPFFPENSHNQTESVAPFALFGDYPVGQYNGRNFQRGDYTISATPFTQVKAQGIPGQTKVIPFELVGGDNLESVASSTVSIYPNPSTQDLVHLNLNAELKGKAQIIVRDKQGNVKLKGEFSTQEIDLNTQYLEPGFYIIEVQTDGHILRKTFIKN